MVYVITDGSGFVKIGTTHQLYSRMAAIQTGNPRKIELIMTFETESMKQDRKLEKILHMEFRKQRVVLDNGYESEWFEDSILKSIAPNTQEFVNYICSKYDFHSNVKFKAEAAFSEIEERRIEKLRNVTTRDVVYGKETYTKGDK